VIGAGKVASLLARHLYSAGHEISGVWSRDRDHTRALAVALGTAEIQDPDGLPVDADIYLMAVSDGAIPEVAGRFRDYPGTWVHTAGAVPMETLGAFDRYGVLYPLQTFTEGRELSLKETPILVEGSDPEVCSQIRSLASSVSENVLDVDSGDRLVIHLAAVFANNFSNHMVTVAGRILKEYGHDPALLGPILRETFRKIMEMGPERAQTGPAARGDQATMEKHLQLLKRHSGWEKIYTFISRDIGK
jgi:predicted short-subunit dehydrogenase-like oxidoreductase (DUF2520 family)